MTGGRKKLRKNDRKKGWVERLSKEEGLVQGRKEGGRKRRERRIDRRRNKRNG